MRDLFPLSRKWTHLAAFFLTSHAKPVAEAIERFRAQIDADPLWLEDAVFSTAQAQPFINVKRALAEYLGAASEGICLTSNTTSALAMAYHGLRIRSDQEILTTEHDHYSHHESIRYSAARSGCTVRHIRLYDRSKDADVSDMVDRLERSISWRTRAVGVTWVHSSTGVKIPIAAIAEVIASANRNRSEADRCLLIVDGVHGLGTQDTEAAGIGCDFFASGTHKWLFAPRGTGILWGRSGAWREMRPTIPSFDRDALSTWKSWIARACLPATEASFVSPGGFLAYEYVLAIPAALEIHRTVGRRQIAARIHALNDAFREGAANISGLTLHTPRDANLSAGLSCFDVAGATAEAVTARLAERGIRTSSSPYEPSHARVSAGIMNGFEDVELVLRELRRI